MTTDDAASLHATDCKEQGAVVGGNEWYEQAQECGRVDNVNVGAQSSSRRLHSADDVDVVVIIVTNEPTMNDIPEKLKKLTIITAALALAEALDRRGRGCGNGGVEVWWMRRLFCGNSLPLFSLFYY